MRIKRMAGLGLAAGALVLSGAIAAVADNSTGATDTAADGAPSAGATATAPGFAPGDERPDRGERARHMVVNGQELSDEQRECMEENAPPPPVEPGERPTREEMGEHREQIEAAMEECDVEAPAGRPGERGDGPRRVMVVGGEELTDEQRDCMEENAPRPAFEPGERPTREEMGEHREQIEAAMDECDIDRPEPAEGDEHGFVFRGERGGAPGPGGGFGGGFGGGEFGMTPAGSGPGG